MANPIGALRAELSASAAAFERDMGRARRVVSGESSRMQRSFRTIGRHASNAAAQIFSLRNAAVAAAGMAGLFALTRRAIQTADEIGKMARQVGVSAEELQELRHAAERAGVSASQFDSNMQAFTRRLGQARQGTGEARAALEALGISMEEIADKSPADVLEIVQERLRGLEDPFERNAVLADLFGRSGIQMANMLGEGSTAIDEMRQRARDLGIVISDDMVARAERANDELDDMSEVFGVAGMSLALEFMPVLRQLAGIFTSGDFQQGISDVAGELGRVIQWMRENIDIVERFAMAWLGITLGARFGPKGAIAGGILGGLSPEMRGLAESFGITGGGAAEADDDALMEDARRRLAAELRGEEEEIDESLDRRQEAWKEYLEELGETRSEHGAAQSQAERERFERELEELERFLEAEGDRHQLRMVEEEERFLERRELLDQALEEERITREEHQLRVEELERLHQDRMTELAEEGARRRAQAEQRARSEQVSAISGFFGDMEHIAQAGGERLFRIQQALAVAQAVVQAYEAAAHAYTWGTRIGGPAVGAAMAATAAAAQMARVAAMQSARVGSSSVSGAGGGGGSSSVSAVSETEADRSMDPTHAMHVTLEGERTDMATVERFLEMVDEYHRDGGSRGRVLVSRQ